MSSKKDDTKQTPARGSDKPGDTVEVLQSTVQQLQEKAATLEVRLAEALAIFDEANDIIYTHDPQGRFLTVNKAGTRVLGYTPEQWRRMTIADVLEPESMARAAESIPGKMEGGARTPPYEVEVKTSDDRMIWLEVSTRVIKEEGQVVAIQGIAREVTERHVAEENMRFQALHDPLTGLPNQRLFFDRLSMALAESRRESSKAAVFFLDLDHFKRINDTEGMGHDVGNALLEEVARRLIGCVRGCDTVARLYGDEFALYITRFTDVDDAGRFAKRLMDSIRPPFEWGGHTLTITASVGISIYPTDSADAKQLLKIADGAMYQAKRSGRNTFRFGDDTLNRLSQNSEIESSFSDSFNDSDLRLLFMDRTPN